MLLLCLSALQPAAAHEGPPYPIIVDQPTGPYLLSVWADPDVGTGTFFVILDPRPRETLPTDTRVEVGVQPVTGRLTEARHPARREPVRSREQYRAEVPFDAEERWRVRVLLQSAGKTHEATTEVDVTPPGLGRFDLVLYLFPFVAVGLLWLRAALRIRRQVSGVRR